MTETSSRHNNDTALSEVIGFVLILGLIAIVASLYLTYGVPSQGREDEISHMNDIKDQFIGYKLSLDSLFTNKQVGMTMSDSFTLGTKGAFTEGMMSIVPIMNPVSSSGIMAINQRSENLTLSSDSFIINTTKQYSTDLPARFNYTPSHVYVNISNIQDSDLSVNGNFGATVNSTSWAAYINLTPATSFYQYYSMPSTATPCAYLPNADRNGTALTVWSNGNTCLVPMNAYAYNGTDLSITVKKGNTITMQNYPIYRNIRAGITYTVDLMDDAYGLKSSTIPPSAVRITKDKSLGSITATGNISYDFVEMNPYILSPIPLGSVEYRSQNNYWIDQTYYYQIGGVFMTQNDGNSTYKLPPEITFSYANISNVDTSKNIVTVNINALTVDPNNRGVVGGNTPVQLKTRLANITPLPYAYTPDSANTKWIRIAVISPDTHTRTMWKNYFLYTATVAGIPHFEVGESGAEAYIRIMGYCDDAVSTTCPFDINVIASQAIYSTSIHGIGGSVQ